VIKSKIRRLLGSEDFEQCLEIFKLKERHSGITKMSLEKFNNSYKKYFELNERYYVFGFFNDKQLTSWVAIAFFNWHEERSWAIINLLTRNFRNYFKWQDSEIQNLIAHAFNFAEDKYYYIYYYTVTKRIKKVYERQWTKEFSLRYEHITEIEIPPNTIPDDKLFWKLMGEELKSDTVIIKKRILKEEHKK